MADETVLEQPRPAPEIARESSIFDSAEWSGVEVKAEAPVPDQADYVGVRFQSVGKVYHYVRGGLAVKVGNWIVVDTPRGKQLGRVATLKPPRNKGDVSFKRIDRLATGRDMVMRHYYETKELEALIACRAESNALALPIKIVRAEYGFDGQTLTFLLSSDQEERVETGDLRQVMSRLYRARIEMRQISPREVAKIIGGMGACGIDQRCCSRFLTEFSPISIKHAKEQNLSLNPHDITGMCGRLRCCLIYEFEQYVEARRYLPKRNAIIGTPAGPGKVVEVLPMREAVVVRIGEGETAKELEFHREQLVPLEELKRLQDKAASGACDKHDGGVCDCGQNTANKSAAPAEQPVPPVPLADGRLQTRSVDAPADETDGMPSGSPADPFDQHSKKRRKKKADSTSTHSQPAMTPSPQPQQQSVGRREHDRRRPSSVARADDPPQTSIQPAEPVAQHRPLRRPLRPRRPPPSASPPSPSDPETQSRPAPDDGTTGIPLTQ